MEKCLKCVKILPFELFELFRSGERDIICLKCRAKDQKTREIIIDRKKYKHKFSLKKDERKRYRLKYKDKIRKNLQTNEAHYSQLKSRAKKHHQEFTLTLNEYKQIVIPNKCHYWFLHSLPLFGAGLDRIDNSKGYSIDNVLPCCTDCNRIRGDRLTVQETEIAIKAVENHRLSIKKDL